MGPRGQGETLAVAERARAGSEAVVRSLAWKILYANHRPSLGPETWDRIVGEVDGPGDVKGLGVDEQVGLAPFAEALDALAVRIAEERDEGHRRLGRVFVDRWATMYQTLVDHLEARPTRMLDVAVDEVVPWFFEGSTLRVTSRGKASALLEPDPRLPAAFQAGLVEGFLDQVDASSAVTVDGDRLAVEWEVQAPEGPNPVQVLAEATRARLLTATLVPVLVGTGVAVAQGSLATGRAVAGLAAAACLHLAANLLNDVFDHRRGVDEANLTPTPFSGGSRVIQRGLLGSRRVWALAGLLAVVGVGLGSWLATAAGIEVLALGVLGVGLGYAYSGDPIRLSHRGLGELTAGLVFGPLIAGGAYAVQAGALTGEALLAGVPVGLMMAGMLAVNELPDARWDERTGKRTLVVRLGDNAWWAPAGAFGLAYACLAGLVLAGAIPWPALAALATAPLAGHVVQGVRSAGVEADELVPYQSAAYWLHASTGLLIAGGVAVGGLV